MDLFKIMGKIVLDGLDKANKDLTNITGTAEKAKGKMGSAFEKIGSAVTKAFKKDKADEFGRSLEGLSYKAAHQQQKIELLKQKYMDLYLTQGKNSKEAKECAAEIKRLSSELAKNQSTLDKAAQAADKFDKSLDQAGDSAEKNGQKLKNALGSGLATAAKIGAKAVTAAVSAAATAIGVVTKNAVENYAEYEQLVGGVETLFNETELSWGEYAKAAGGATQEVFEQWSELTAGGRKVINNADNAYKTAGLSANEYMETVTSFSASLLQSLGGDTVKAADMADLAITDMADNANKMGSDMTSIQNAYQGFAKQNYTMLDNLKLGYGGTKEEMERLIDDANALNAAQGKLTDYSIDSYADIVSAIHDVQTEMGITGTTAEEASETIQGSISSAKAAWQNWLTALGDSNADVEAKTDELIESIGIAAQNLLPVFEQVLSSLGRALETKLPELLSDAISFVVTHLPDILALGWQLVLALADGLGQGFEELMSMMGEWAHSTIVEPIQDKIEDFKTAIKDGFESAKNTVISIFDSIKTGIEDKIEAAKDTVESVVDKIKEFFDFEVQLPEIKLPHFSISPAGWRLGDLLKGSIPKLGIEWYAKGGVFDEPTIFPTANGLKGVGEAGAEAVAPITVLQGYVAAAVASQNKDLVLILQKILDAVLELDANMGGNLREALDGTSLKVNQREFGRLVRGVANA